MAQPGNYLVNGGFEDDFRGWNYFQGASATVNYSIETANPIDGGKSAKMEVTGTGSAAFEAALQQRFTVHKDKEVQISFDIVADAATTVNLEVCRGYGDYDPIVRSTASVGGATPDIPIGTTVQTLSYTVTPSYSDANYIFSLMLGTTPSGVTIWIDNVKIHQTDSMWDGNIMPNSEINEIWPRDPSLPAVRTAQLAYSIQPWVDGGIEGGFADQATFPTLDVMFGVDSTSKLSGQNSFMVDMTNKDEVNEFWGSANFIYFQAHAGETYEFSMEVMAEGMDTVSFATAMNEEPWAATGGDIFWSTVNATSTPQTFTVQSNAFLRPVDTTLMHKVFMANFPAGQNYQIYMDNIRMIRVGAADTNSTDPSSSIDRSAAFSGMEVYPNPSINGTFKLHFGKTVVPTGADVNARLLTIDGKQVMQRNLFNNGGEVTFDTGLSRGIYLLVMKYENHNFVTKLIVE